MGERKKKWRGHTPYLARLDEDLGQLAAQRLLHGRHRGDLVQQGFGGLEQVVHQGRKERNGYPRGRHFRVAQSVE